MKRLLLIPALLLTLRVSAQLVVGSGGLTTLSGTLLSYNGLTLTPSASLSLVNNSIQLSSTPLAGNPSVNRLYQFSAPVSFSGTVGIYYLPSELNGYTESTLQLAYSPAASTSLSVTTGSSVDGVQHYVQNQLSGQSFSLLTATALSDLTPVLYARPSTLIGTNPVTVIIDVFEINGVATTAPITLKISKDAKITLTFDGTSTSVGGQSVQNSQWTYGGLSGGFYTLTSSSVLKGSQLSVGLMGQLTPGSSTGTLNVSGMVAGGGEGTLDNNSDADKIEYFQQ